MRRTGTALTAISLALGIFLLAACAADQAVTFGAVVPLSGPLAAYGESIKQGLELAHSHLQEDTELGFQVELEIVDSEGDPAKAAELTGRLYENGALAIIGGVSSAEALEMVGVSRRNDKILLSPTASSDQLSGASRTFYRIFPTALQEVSAMTNFALNTLKIEELVILAEERPFTQSVLQDLQAVFTQSGGKVAEILEFPSDTTEFTEVIERALELEPGGVYLATSGDRTAQLVGLLRERGYGRSEDRNEWVLTTSAFAHPAVIAEAGSAANGVYLTMTIFDSQSEASPMAEFAAAYRQAYGGEPNLYVGQGYDALLVFGEALKASSSTLPSEFLKGMRAMDPPVGVTGTAQFNEDGDVQKFPRIHLISDGQLIDFQQYRKQREEEMRERLEQLRRETMRLRSGQPDGTSE